MTKRICIEEGCTNPAPEKIRQGTRCYSCRRARQRKNREAVPCRKCREPTKFPVRGLCDRCRCRERVKNLPVGTCVDCQRERPIMARSRCNSCYQSHMRRQKPKRPCSDCGNEAHVYSSGFCSRCKSRIERRARELRRARQAILEDGKAVTVRVTEGRISLWLSIEIEQNGDLNSLVRVLPRAAELLVRRCRERLARRGAKKGAA